MKATVFVCAALFALAVGAVADDFKLSDGRKYKGVTVSRVEPDGLIVVTDSGVEKIPFALLSKEVQQKYHYDPRAAAYAQAKATAIQHAAPIALPQATPAPTTPGPAATEQTASTWARLGETFEECKARYGEPVKVFQNANGPSPVFTQAGFQIEIEFYDGKAGLIAFLKPSDLTGKHEPLSDTEIATLLEANGSNSPWHEIKDTGARDWKTEDGLSFAVYSDNQLWLANKVGMTRHFGVTFDDDFKLSNGSVLHDVIIERIDDTGVVVKPNKFGATSTIYYWKMIDAGQAEDLRARQEKEQQHAALLESVKASSIDVQIKVSLVLENGFFAVVIGKYDQSLSLYVSPDQRSTIFVNAPNNKVVDGQKMEGVLYPAGRFKHNSQTVQRYALTIEDALALSADDK